MFMSFPDGLIVPDLPDIDDRTRGLLVEPFPDRERRVPDFSVTVPTMLNLNVVGLRAFVAIDAVEINDRCCHFYFANRGPPTV